jgi:uncharacterized protein
LSVNLYDRLSRISAFAPVRRREPLLRADTKGQNNLLTALNAEVGRNRYGEYLVSRQWYATPETFEASSEVIRLLLQSKSQLPERAYEIAADPSKWLFLDTETTGLAGGTGTYAFLVGLAWWESGGIRTEQLFMRDHDEEHAVLLEVAQRLDERSVLVTFNGKCFDWPLLQNRFRMTREIEVPSLSAHLDFLHPARQFWRLRLGSVRLAELEQHVLGAETLGWSREHDIDSSGIPEVYFDFVRGGGTSEIASVLLHNRMDLRGLATLAGRIFALLANSAKTDESQEALELYSISRFLSRRGERLKARQLCEHSLDQGLPEPIARRAMHEAAKLAKRDGDFGRAIELWHKLATSSDTSFEALEQLAIYYERYERNTVRATSLTRLALNELRRASRLGLIRPERHDRLCEQFKRRLARLEAKVSLSKSLLDCHPS